MGLLAVSATVSGSATQSARFQHQWLTPVRWQTLRRAKQSHRPILLTNCPADFSGPLLAEIVARDFAPAVVMDGRPQHVSIINEAGATVYQVQLRDDSRGTVATVLATALVKTRQSVDKPLKLMIEQYTGPPSQQATFSTPCFWHGEGGLGAIDGVIATLPGRMGMHEVVKVTFNPAVVSYQSLAVQAHAMGFEDALAAKVAGVFEVGFVCRTGEAAAVAQADLGPKFYLQQSPLRAVPMISAQQCRVNAALYHGQSPLPFLSPNQRELAAMVMAHPDAGWSNAIGVPLEQGWSAAASTAGRLGIR